MCESLKDIAYMEKEKQGPYQAKCCGQNSYYWPIQEGFLHLWSAVILFFGKWRHFEESSTVMARPTPNLQKDIYQVRKISKLSYTRYLLIWLSDFKISLCFCFIEFLVYLITPLIEANSYTCTKITCLSTLHYHFQHFTQAQGNIKCQIMSKHYFLNFSHRWKKNWSKSLWPNYVRIYATARYNF